MYFDNFSFIFIHLLCDNLMTNSNFFLLVLESWDSQVYIFFVLIFTVSKDKIKLAIRKFNVDGDIVNEWKSSHVSNLFCCRRASIMKVYSFYSRDGWGLMASSLQKSLHIQQNRERIEIENRLSFTFSLNFWSWSTKKITEQEKKNTVNILFVFLWQFSPKKNYSTLNQQPSHPIRIWYNERRKYPKVMKIFKIFNSIFILCRIKRRTRRV